MSILLHRCTTWTLTKRMERKLGSNCTRMLRAVLSKSWRRHPTKQQLYGHLPPISKIIQIRRSRHAGHCWRSKVELISDVLLWAALHGRAKVGRPARNYLQQLIEQVAWKIYREWWTIGTGDGRESGKSVLAARYDNDDDDRHCNSITKEA